MQGSVTLFGMSEIRPTQSRKERPVFTLRQNPTDHLPPGSTLGSVRTALSAETLKVRYGQIGSYTPLRFCKDRHIRVGCEGAAEEITWSLPTSRDVLRVKEMPWTIVPEAGWFLFKGNADAWILRSLETGGTHGIVRSVKGPAHNILLSPRGDRLALLHKKSDSENPSLSLYQVPTGKEIRIRVFESEIRTAAFSPDGARIALGTDDGWVRIFSTENLEKIGAFGIESTWGPASLALNHTGSRVATNLRTGEVFVWDETGERIADLTTTLGAQGKGALFFLGEVLGCRLPTRIESSEVVPETPQFVAPPRTFALKKTSVLDPATKALKAAPPKGLLPRRDQDLVPGSFWGERARVEDGLWVDSVTQLPLFAWRSKDGAPMVLVPEGPTESGETNPPVVRPGFPPPPRLTLRPGTFYLDQFPVTVGMFASYLEASGAEEPHDWERQQQTPQAPVVFVHFQDARGYARWAGGILPKESEWVRAARAEDARRFPWGPVQASHDELARYGRGHGGSPGPVDEFPLGASPFAVLAMAGNVSEWCSDPYPVGLEGDGYAWEEPDRMGEDFGVVKGGSYRDDWVKLRLSGRWPHPRDERVPWIGFRLMMPVQPRPEPHTLSCWPQS